MKHQKVLNLLNEANNSKFVTITWNIVNDNSKSIYDEGNEIIYNSKSNLFDYNDGYVLVRGNITIATHNSKQVAFKNCAPFNKYITNIGDAEDLDLVMAMYNLIEYTSKYSEITVSLWLSSKDEATDECGYC